MVRLVKIMSDKIQFEVKMVITVDPEASDVGSGPKTPAHISDWLMDMLDHQSSATKVFGMSLVAEVTMPSNALEWSS